jgi:hypothetical protein
VSNYVYKRLEKHEIRVLELRPGSGVEPLFGLLEHLQLPERISQRPLPLLDTDSIANYAAISYAWGEPVFDRSIHIGPHEIKLSGGDRISFVNALRAFVAFDLIITVTGISSFDAKREKWISKLYRTRNRMWASDEFSATRFLELLMKASHLRVTEPHDRVFALAPIANRDDLERIKVDYEITLSTLWRQVAMFILEAPTVHWDSSGRNLAILALRGTQCDTAEGISSWAPDFGALNAASQRKYL